jgi:hypothetical protein
MNANGHEENPSWKFVFIRGSPILDFEICYLLLVPLQPQAALGPTESAPTPKDAPYFFDLDVEFRAAGEGETLIDRTPVHIRRQVLDDTVWLAECRYRLPDALGESAVTRKVALQSALKQHLQREAGYGGSLNEEYTILLIHDVASSPDAFVDEHAAALACLLRSVTEPLNEVDASDILAARARYSEHDLTIVDWVGGLIIAKHGDFQSDVELMKIGNYQILRYRLLDRAIELSLHTLRENLERARLRWIPSSNRTLHAIVEQRLSLLLDFEKIDQSLLLIGDWYSARVYRLVVEQFYLDDWRTTVSAKLDNLSAIDGIVRENLTFSWRRVLDSAQLIGWLIMLAGYYVLFYLDWSSR